MGVLRTVAMLAGFTADQWGLVTTAQATGAGVDSPTLARLVEAGLFEHVRRGVYAVTAAPQDELRAVRAAWLQLDAGVPAWQRPLLDPRGVLSHGTAAQVHELGDLLTGAFEFTAPGRRSSTQPDIAFHRLPLPEGDVVRVNGLPVTAVDRTIADLLAAHVDGGHVGDMVHQALRRRQVDITTLAQRVGRYARRYGVAGGDGMALVHALLEQAGRTTPSSSFRDMVDHMAHLVSKAVRASVEESPQVRQMQAELVDNMLSSPGMLRVQEQLARALADNDVSPEVVSRLRVDQESDDPFLANLRRELLRLTDPDSSERSDTTPGDPLVFGRHKTADD